MANGLCRVLRLVMPLAIVRSGKGLAAEFTEDPFWLVVCEWLGAGG